MVRRKHQLYRPSAAQMKSKFGRGFSADSTPQTHANVVCSSTAAAAGPVVRPPTLTRKKLSRLKPIIVKVIALNAGLSWASVILGYTIVWLNVNSSESDTGQTAIKCVLLLISCLQVPLVVAYSEVTSQYYDLVRRALTFSLDPSTVPSKLGFSCLMECAFHVICPIPNVNWEGEYTLFGKTARISLDLILFCVVLLRSYHSFQLMFWLSRFANFRTQLFTNLVNVVSYEGFLLRCYLAAYPYRFVLVVIGVMIIVPGALKYVLESRQMPMNIHSEFNDLWIVAYSQLTIGYGDSVPRLFIVQFMIVLSCLLGVLILGLFNSISTSTLLLSLTECNLYSELLYSKRKLHYSDGATILIQRWWRLMLMRKRKLLDVKTIMSFFSFLSDYRASLLDCQHVKDTRFERQIEAFEKSTISALRHCNEYLRPITFAYTTVTSKQMQDVLRSQYRIKMLCANMHKFARRHRGANRHSDWSALGSESPATVPIAKRTSHLTPRAPKSRSEHSSQGRAKANLQAYQNVMGRLIKEESLSSLQHRARD